MTLRPYTGQVRFNLTVAQAADEAGVSLATMRRWCASGKVRSSHFGKAWMIDETSLPSGIKPGLRSRIKELIKEYREEALWIDQVPYLVRSQVVDDLERALDP